jgi:hypothetical protein
LHENPDEKTEKTRGHLGSQLERKAEANIRIEKDKDGIGSIYTNKSRHALITKAQAHLFKFDTELDMHVSLSGDESRRARRDESDVVEQVFDCGAAQEQAGRLKWAEFLDRLVELELSANRNSARQKLRKLLTDGWVSKHGDYYQPAA